MGGSMQALSGFARKYAIMEELDQGFGAGSTPEAFVRLDSWEGRIQASLNVKGLKQGPFTYKLYLIFAKGDRLVPLPAGSLNTAYSGMQGGLAIEADNLKNSGLKPEMVRYAAITAESQDKKWVPLFSSFEKNYKWDESIRQVLLRKPSEEMRLDNTPQPAAQPQPTMQYQPAMIQNIMPEPMMQQPNMLQPILQQPNMQQPILQQPNMQQLIRNEEANQPARDAKFVPQQENPDIQNSHHETEMPAKTNMPQTEQNSAGGCNQPRQVYPENRFNKCDLVKLEGFLQNNFEEHQPFKRANRGYSWYRVSDLAKLSNIMYMSGINVPVFANPKILVGLFKFKHILAGLYRGDNGANYYVIGVPAKDDNDNKPFEHACRWVPVSDSPIRDMGGYWLVYVSLRSGEIVV